MLTVLESIKLSTEYLEKKGIESPRVNAELLLAGILNCKRLDLYLRFDQPLKENEKNIYRDFISRRGKFEPLQYILGKTEFYGVEFLVNKNVLIPRQETEILVENICNYNFSKSDLRILDIGTGSGILAVLLAKHFQESEITAIDISQDAINVAKENALLSGVEKRITFVKTDILNNSEISYLKGFDLIVSNPPYVSLEEYNTLQKEILLYEPAGAVTDNHNGLTFYKKIVETGEKMLNENGLLFFELGQGQAEDVKTMMETEGYKNINTFKDYLNIDRVICGERN